MIPAFDDTAKFPSEVYRVVDARVHPLRYAGGVDVAGIAGEDDVVILGEVGVCDALVGTFLLSALIVVEECTNWKVGMHTHTESTSRRFSTPARRGP